MAGKMFAVLGPDGALITATRGSLSDAIGEAAEISGNVHDVIVDGTAESAAGRGSLEPNESLVQLRAKGAGPYSGTQVGAYRGAMLPDVNEGNEPTDRLPLVSGDRMLYYMQNPRKAWEQFRGFFPKKKWIKSHEEWRPIYVYDTPAGLAKSLFGQNAKTKKEDPNAKLGKTLLHRGKRGAIMTSGVSLMPAQKAWGVDDSGDKKPYPSIPNLCVQASPECRAACLVYTGHNQVDKYNNAVKLARVKSLYTNPEAFVGLMAYEIERRRRNHMPNGIYDFIRFNVFSDIPWEVVCPDMFDYFRDVQFYDYTKVPERNVPPNYDLTLSFSGKNDNTCKRSLANGRRVAVVFLSGPAEERFGARKEMQFGQSKMFWPLPERFWGHQVVNGDFSDARPCDPVNAESDEPCVVGLHYKIPQKLEERLGEDKKFEKFVVEAFKATDPRQSGYQRFREWYTGRRKKGMEPNPGFGLPTIVTQVHEIDGWLCVAGTPVHEGANDWHEED